MLRRRSGTLLEAGVPPSIHLVTYVIEVNDRPLKFNPLSISTQFLQGQRRRTDEEISLRGHPNI